MIALVASEKAVSSGWAGLAALDLARAWSKGGEKVILADGALNYPTLHQLAELENAEGLSDAALYGASVRRVARQVAGESFFLITAGTAVANANTVPGSPRWGKLVDGFKEAGVKLVLFVRDGDSGCAAFLDSASDIVVLADRGEHAPGAVRDREDLVRAVTGPGVAGGSEARPPVEWTAEEPEGKKRVTMIVVVAVVLIVLLVVAFLSIDFGATSGG
ncbi:MAG: hypothetical protein AB7T31_08080 [Gemmatimonadales bacterium]